jgi:hypothetical protein
MLSVEFFISLNFPDADAIDDGRVLRLLILAHQQLKMKSRQRRKKGRMKGKDTMIWVVWQGMKRSLKFLSHASREHRKSRYNILSLQVY